MDADTFRSLADQLPRMLGRTDADWSEVALLDGPEPLATPMPIGQVASLALGAVGMAASTILRGRGAPAGPVRVDPFAAALAMCANDYLRVDGKPPGSWPELTRFYRAADGWVYLHGGFPPHAVRLVAALDAPPDRDGLAARVAQMPAQEVEDRCVATNTCGRRLRTAEEWRNDPAAQAVAVRPALTLQRLGLGDLRPWAPASMPLQGIRVLDLSRVLAGPTIGRTLAEHGADVMRIASPRLPFIEPLVIDTGYGKRSAHVDLETAEGRAALASLIREADVFIDGYRPGALARHDLGPEALAGLNPGIICLTLSAFGETGPWGGLRGYDSLVQAAAGLASGDPPRRLPCQPLDYLAGYLGAFAVMTALDRRAETGAGGRIELSLAGMADWLVQMADRIGPVDTPAERNPQHRDIPDEMCRLDTVFGQVSALRPALDVPWRRRTWAPPVRLGTHPAQWLPRR